MDVSSLATIVASLGFPIAACLGMAYYVKYITDKNQCAIIEMTKVHKAESDSFTTALNNNTLALQKLSIMIDTQMLCERRNYDN